MVRRLPLSMQNLLRSIYSSRSAAVCVPQVTSLERQQTQTEHNMTMRALLASQQFTLTHSDTDFIIDQKIVLLHNDCSLNTNIEIYFEIDNCPKIQ